MAALVVTAWSGVAAAEESCPLSRSPSEARRLAGREFAAGQQLYERGEYQAAIARFECSYDLVPHRDTLFNIARTAEAAGDDELALDRYRALLREHPDDPDRGEIEARIRRLQGRLEAREPVEAPPPRHEDPGDEPAPMVFGLTAEDPSPPSRASMSGLRIAAWATLAVGGAAAIAGGALLGAAASENHAYVTNRDLLGWSREALRESHDRGVALETAGWVMIGVGASALVATLVLFLTSRRRPTTEDQRRAERFALVPMM